MRPRLIKTMLTGCLAMAFSMGAQAVIVDFESLTSGSRVTSHAGLTLDTDPDHGSGGFYYQTTGGNSGKYIWNAYGEDDLGITFGSAVTLNSVDFNLNPQCCGDTTSNDLTIHLLDGSSALLDSVVVSNSASWQTVSFNVAGVVRMVMDVGGGINPYDGHSAQHDWYGLDNIVYDESVPAPASLAIFGVGLIAFAIRRRRKTA